MKLITEYTIVLRPDDNGTFVAYIPAIPGCHAWGQTPDEAREELGNVFEMIQEEYSEEGRELPDDVKLVIANARRQQANWKELPKNWVLLRHGKRGVTLVGSTRMDELQLFLFMVMQKLVVGYFMKFLTN